MSKGKLASELLKRLSPANKIWLKRLSSVNKNCWMKNFVCPLCGHA